MAKVGYERIQEIENPELAQERMKQLYEQKGYPQDWIDKRLRGIAIRQNLTDEWQELSIILFFWGATPQLHVLLNLSLYTTCTFRLKGF